MNKWQVFWRSMDEARMIVRIMVFAKFTALVLYVFIVSSAFFDIVTLAMNKDLDLAQVVGIMTAITAFSGVTIPVLAGMYKEVWKDYRESGTDWKGIAERDQKPTG